MTLQKMTQLDMGPHLEALAAQIRSCVQCPLHRSRTFAVPGEGKPSATVMLIGEAPGKEEDASGRPFVGAAGRVLDHVLERNGLSRDTLFITNIVKCRPPQNRAPHKSEIETCISRYLFPQITLLSPKLIVLLGRVAAKTLLGITRLDHAHGCLIERDGRMYFATYHPAAGFYRREVDEKVTEDFGNLKDVLKNLSSGTRGIS